MTSQNLYLQNDSKAAKLYGRATRVMPGGNTRATLFSKPYPTYVNHGSGCRIIDEDGQTRIDFFNNATSLILGHANPAVVEAIVSQVYKGTCFGMPTESEIELAEILTSRVPAVDTIRFCNSGSEAVMFAVKAARAHTGKHKIAKFEGSYHGSYDEMEISLESTLDNAGDPKAPNRVYYYRGASPRFNDEVVILPFNDLEAVESLLTREKESLAGVVFDPLPGRSAYAKASPEFAAGLREITRRLGIVLIADEVMSFRVGYNGAQAPYGIEADLTTFGKVIGGGFPIGAVGGKAEVMSVFDPSKGRAVLPHYGTFNANPVTMVAGAAVLKQMTKERFDYIGSLGQVLRTKLNNLLERAGVDAQASGDGSLFKIIMTSKPLVNYRSQLMSNDRKALSADLFIGLLARGCALSPALQGNISVPMTMAEIDTLVAAVADWIEEKRSSGKALPCR